MEDTHTHTKEVVHLSENKNMLETSMGPECRSGSAEIDNEARSLCSRRVMMDCDQKQTTYIKNSRS